MEDVRGQVSGFLFVLIVRLSTLVDYGGSSSSSSNRVIYGD